MNLKEVFDNLEGSELIQISVGGQPAGEINEDNAPRIVRHLNLALTNIYTRFNLKEGRLVLEPVAGKAVYAIDSRFAVNKRSSREPVRYLVDDAASPFADDVLKIEQVLTAEGFELTLNDELNRYSVFTPTAASLRLPLDLVNQTSDLPDQLKTEHFELVYRASHPKVAMPVGLYDPSRVHLQLPETHMEPLLYFIASRIHMPTGMNAQLNDGDPYMQKYEMACQRLEGKGMQRDETAAYDKVRSRGWV